MPTESSPGFRPDTEVGRSGFDIPTVGRGDDFPYDRGDMGIVTVRAPRREASGLPMMLKRPQVGTANVAPGSSGPWANDPPRVWDDDQPARSSVVPVDVHIVEPGPARDISPNAWAIALGLVDPQDSAVSEREVMRPPTSSVEKGIMVSDVDRFVESLERVLSEGKKKKKDKEASGVQPSGYQTAEALDFSAPLGARNRYRRQGQMDPISLTGVVESPVPTDSAWFALFESTTHRPESVWEHVSRWYDHQKRGLGEKKLDPSKMNKGSAGKKGVNPPRGVPKTGKAK